jgi:Asp/Glu/hydantoin racemase
MVMRLFFYQIDHLRKDQQCTIWIIQKENDFTLFAFIEIVEKFIMVKNPIEVVQLLGIIRVLTTDDEKILNEHGKKLKEYFSIESVTRCIPSQPNGIYDDESEKKAIPKIVELAKELAEKPNIDAITISCAADPGLDEARNEIDLPVLGAGGCGAHAASMVGNRIGIIGITDAPPARMKEELGRKFHSYSYHPSLRKTTDLFASTAKDELLEVVKDVINSGADCILFACTGFSTIGLKDYLNGKISVPVIDLVEAQGIGYQLIKKGS